MATNLRRHPIPEDSRRPRRRRRQDDEAAAVVTVESTPDPVRWRRLFGGPVDLITARLVTRVVAGVVVSTLVDEHSAQTVTFRRAPGEPLGFTVRVRHAGPHVDEARRQHTAAVLTAIADGYDPQEDQ